MQQRVRTGGRHDVISVHGGERCRQDGSQSLRAAGGGEKPLCASGRSGEKSMRTAEGVLYEKPLRTSGGSTLRDAVAMVRIPRANVHVSRSALERNWRAAGTGRLRRARRSAHEVIRLLDGCVADGVTPLRLTLGDAQPCIWQHYADGTDQVVREAGWFFYYHSHDLRLPGEHGHFHVFARTRLSGRRDAPAFSHLVGVGVDAQGIPLRLFTANRWVTGDTWQDAGAMARALDRIVASQAAAADPVERWIRSLLALFSPQITLLLKHRDNRVAMHGGARVFEDHRIRVLSECRVSLDTQVAAIDAVSP